MGCIGGCINGGGQPILTARGQELVDIKAKRASVLYKEDENHPLRKSHLNESMMLAYKEFLGEPNSKIAHKYLHTHYTKRDIFPNKD